MVEMVKSRVFFFFFEKRLECFKKKWFVGLILNLKEISVFIIRRRNGFIIKYKYWSLKI